MDHEIFPCDIKGMDWTEYNRNYCLGLRIYLGKESMDSIEIGRKKQFKLYLAHLTVKYLYYGFIVYLIYLILSFYGFFDYLKSNFENLI